jgi:hypothetical protein
VILVVAWLKKQWKWVLLGVALVGVFLAGFFSRRPKVISPSQETEDKKREIEEESEEKKVEALEERDSHILDIQKKHDTAVKELVEEQTDRVEDLQSDPKELNEWLIEVGKNNRR